jgi:glutaredoxin
MTEKRQPFTIQKYILAFFVVVIIFTFGFLLSDYINDKRFLEIERAREKFQIQIMGMETQLAHFRDILCPEIGDDILAHELHLIGEKLQFMSNAKGKDHPEVIHFKKYYTLLQIKHYQFSKELNQRCNLRLTHILYFFAEKKDCPDCEKQGYILTNLRQNHPHLRIYSFNYNLELPALSIIKPIIPTKDKEKERGYLPIIVINEEPFFGFRDFQEMKKLLQLE